MASGWGNGSTRKWRVIRLAVLRRDQYRCQLRIEGTCKTVADCVHHVHGKARGDNPADLLASCTPCNLQIGDPTKQDPPLEVRTVW